jgi:hypothetical protein
MGLIPRSALKKQKDTFTNVPVGTGGSKTLGASGSATFSFTVDGDSDFVTTELRGAVYTASYAAIVANPAILVDVIDSGSGRSPFSQPVLFDNLFGTAQRPGTLPYPKLFRANSTVNVELSNQVATAYVVELAFVGFKVFPMPEAVS